MEAHLGSNLLNQGLQINVHITRGPHLYSAWEHHLSLFNARSFTSLYHFSQYFLSVRLNPRQTKQAIPTHPCLTPEATLKLLPSALRCGNTWWCLQALLENVKEYFWAPMSAVWQMIGSNKPDVVMDWEPTMSINYLLSTLKLWSYFDMILSKCIFIWKIFVTS